MVWNAVVLPNEACVSKYKLLVTVIEFKDIKMSKRKCEP